MMAELERALFDKTKSKRTMVPASYLNIVAQNLGLALIKDQPLLMPPPTYNAKALAVASAEEAIPIIKQHYTPPRSYIKNTSTFLRMFKLKAERWQAVSGSSSDLAGIFKAYIPSDKALRSLTAPLRGDGKFWLSFTYWLRGEKNFQEAFATDLDENNPYRRFFADPFINLQGNGQIWDSIYSISMRMALYETYKMSHTTLGGEVFLAPSVEPAGVPFTALHETMHQYIHPDFKSQLRTIGVDPALQGVLDEGLNEYMSRGIREKVVNAVYARTPPLLTAAQASRARKWGGYRSYFRKVRSLRDILYRHGQDGEMALRRVYFHGEGWRLGLLGQKGKTSPVESDRPVPKAADVYFRYARWKIIDDSPLDPIVSYMQGRSVATAKVVGRTDRRGSHAYNDRLGMFRAYSVRSYLGSKGIVPTRVRISSRGKRDTPLSGLDEDHRRATVQVEDPLNTYPGIMRKPYSYITASILWFLNRL